MAKTVIRNYLSLIKFSHTLFALPFALIGFVLGVAQTDDNFWNTFRRADIMLKFVLVLACMVFARSAAMAFNRYLDRHFDAANPRTSLREIPAGILRAERVLAFTIGNSLLFMLSSYFINTLCFYLSPAALLLILGYSYTKRFTSLCHLVLGLGLSLAPVGAYLAVTGYFSVLPILFSVVVITWVSGFDVIYALQDEEFDRSQGLHSLPARLGKARALSMSWFLHLASMTGVIIIGFTGDFGGLYWAGAVFFAVMLFYQHSIVSPQDLSKVNIAFMTTNGLASIVYASLVIIDVISR